MATLDIVGLCGSLRAGSLNRAALRLAGQCLPAGLQLETLEWRGIPVFDGDLMAAGLPAAVTALAERIARADGLVIATPEYNFAVPGGLKNVIDWLSRCQPQPFARKPVAVISASMGPLGGARVQYELRRSLGGLEAMLLAKPEVFIGIAQTKFDAAGACTDETTRKFVTEQMLAFQGWVAGVKRMTAPA